MLGLCCCAGFALVAVSRLLPNCSAWASHCWGCSRWGSRAPRARGLSGSGLQSTGATVVVCGLSCSAGWVAPRPVGSSQTRGRTHVPCIDRWILYHWATREAQEHAFSKDQDWRWEMLLRWGPSIFRTKSVGVAFWPDGLQGLGGDRSRWPVLSFTEKQRKRSRPEGQGAECTFGQGELTWLWDVHRGIRSRNLATLHPLVPPSAIHCKNCLSSWWMITQSLLE